jgi:hypothetical protein
MKSRMSPPSEFVETPALDQADSDELHLWLQRANELFGIAAEQGDVKTGLTAITTAIKALTGLVKQKDRAAKQAARAVSTGGGDSIDDLDAVVEKYLIEVKAAGHCFACGNKVGANGFAANPQPNTFPAILGELINEQS